MLLDQPTLDILDSLFIKPRPVVKKRTRWQPKKTQNGVGLLDRQRSTNIEIVLRRVTRPIGRLVCAVMEYDTTALSEEMLAALIETLPTQDEFTSLSKYAVSATLLCAKCCPFRDCRNSKPTLVGSVVRSFTLRRQQSRNGQASSVIVA